MAIDIRANVTCSLGVVINGNVGDDYLQGSGLIKTQGSCEIAGLITPTIGQLVTFSYNKEGLTRNIPRTLRVLSYFADPFRNTTKVELGCKLTYLSDLKDSIDWTAFNGDGETDASEAGFNENDERIIIIPIRASTVMLKCLSELGLAASSYPLTNQFSIASFDLSGGYVQILSDLLVSESYFGYLDTNEMLQIVDLTVDRDGGPVITAADIIDLSAIGVGQLPGESVTVSYDTLKLKREEIPAAGPEPDLDDVAEDEEAREIQRTNWELDRTESSPQAYFVSYANPFPAPGAPTTLVATYSGRSYSEVYTTYTLLSIYNNESRDFEEREVVRSRFTKNYGPIISVATPFAKAYLEVGASFSNADIQISGVNEYYDYYENGNYVVVRRESFKTRAEQAASTGIDLAYTASSEVETIVSDLVSSDPALIMTEYTETKSWTQGNATKQTTAIYKLNMDTAHGQLTLAALREDVESAAQAEDVIDYALGGLTLDSYTVQSKTSGQSLTASAPGRPRADVRVAESNAKDGDPSNNYRTSSQASLELVTGSLTAQRRIEFSLPYAPDDTFYKSSPTVYYSRSSDAPAKANRFGRIQNRLLLGNRSGISLQLAPERMPVAPFDPIYVIAANLTSAYRTNGNQWAFDSNGIVCSTDALYWGVAGKVS